MAVRRCSSCGQPGHTWRTCKNEKAQRENDDENDDVPAKPLVPPITQRPKLNYDKEALEADIRAGHLSPTTIASRHGVSIATVYQIKSVMKKEGRLDAPAEKPKSEDEEKDDGLPDELSPEEESEDEDADDIADPFAYRGTIAGGEL